MKDILQLSSSEILEEAQKLRIAYTLKNTIRYGTERPESHAESVAEHVFALIYLAHYFLEHEPKARSLNKEKVYDILLFHDFGEIKDGDIPYHWKTKQDELKEVDAAIEIFASLPEPIATLGKERWEEYEYKKSPEGNFAYALDKIEPLFELLHPVNEKTMKRLKFNRDMHMGKKMKATEEYPVMRRFLDVITEDMDSRDIFWKE
jgi:putative hydrolases of HD superfamily